MLGERGVSSEGWQSGTRGGGHVSHVSHVLWQTRGVVIVIGDCGGVVAERVAHDVTGSSSGALHILGTKVGAEVNGLGPGLDCCGGAGVVVVLGSDLAVVESLTQLG
jgi:hypothetical protein